jgi:carbon starvation protein
MLAEAFVALIALVTVMTVAPADVAGLAPGTIYGNGIGRFLSLLIGPENLGFAVTFGAMVFSTFVFDTLDVCTRLGRYLVQELFGWRGWAGALGATLLTIGLPAVLLGFATEGMWVRFWTLFGASNQLLAALTLLAITVWLYRSRRRIAFTLVPMLFVLVLTVWALSRLAWANGVAWLQGAEGSGLALLNSLAALALLSLAFYLVVAAILAVRGGRRPALAEAASPS